ncbi:DUF2752 domain-containing protein [Mycobacterium decipiens]|uniref:DUF2752 domain-containing protein n=1 Tax=Mycobacterium decipiens TaxID=1430326 RepID=A0A1X2LVW2_9MYCO|nr:DUF2752 domain-containing protein [Mycobacterium decipiens]OSC41285.1 hypothetical protein B8W66_09420 [Mycobacterium decipiens]
MGPSRASGAPTAGAQRGRRHGRYAAASTGALLIGALGYIALVDPHNTNSLYPPCPFKLLTGWNCPACGGLRMTHDLMHGELAASINDNVFLLVGSPVLAGWLVLRRRQGRTALPIPVMIAVAIAVIAWTVLRNLPGFPLVPGN